MVDLKVLDTMQSLDQSRGVRYVKESLDGAITVFRCATQRCIKHFIIGLRRAQ